MVGVLVGVALGVPLLVVVVTFVFGAQIRGAFQDGPDRDGPVRDEAGKVTGAHEIPTGEVRAGDCLVDSGFSDPAAVRSSYGDSSDPVTRVTVVPCSETHEVEAYYTGSLTEDQYPGVERMTAEIAQACRERFHQYVGVDFDHSELFALYYYPLEKTWAEDKGFTCVVSEGSLSTRGTLRDARR
jgi:Septum formation